MTDPVSLLLQKYKIINYRDLFGKKQYSKANMPKELDYLIKPFLLTEEQRGCRAGLLEISQSTILLRIQPFLDDDAATFQISKRQPQSGTPNERNFRKGSTASDKKRKLGANSEDDPKKKPKAERKRKGAKEDPPQLLLPHILQPILQEIFDEFWNLELQPEVAIPFFTTITRDNCLHLGMPDFYDKISTECTFATMKEKLSKSQYTLPEQFENDFNLMINNVLTYFPSTAIQSQKAIELKAIFDEQWKGALRRMSELLNNILIN